MSVRMASLHRAEAVRQHLHERRGSPAESKAVASVDLDDMSLVIGDRAAPLVFLIECGARL